MSKTRVVYLQPTPFCNIDCSYCYLPDRTNPARMSLDVLSAAFRSLFAGDQCADEVDAVWHAGEPTVLPVAYYREAFAAVERLRPARVTLAHTIQTNGTRIDDGWCDFFEETGAHLGVSIDGPQEIHDAHRRRRNGRGTFAAVMRGIERLRARSIPFAVLAVVSERNVDRPDEMFAFFERLGVERINFLAEDILGVHPRSTLEPGDAKQRFTAFLVRYADLVIERGSRQRVREIEKTARAIVQSARTDVGNLLTEPFGIVTVGHDGSFSTFCPELLTGPHPRFGDFVLGNFLHGDDVQAASRTPKFLRVAAEIEAGVAQCRATCAYFHVCGGGTPSTKLWEHGRFDVTETLSCRTRFQATADAVVSRLVRDRAMPS